MNSFIFSLFIKFNLSFKKEYASSGFGRLSLLSITEFILFTAKLSIKLTSAPSFFRYSAKL